jgi:hypothetical protein
MADQGRPHFEELDVERINVVDESGVTRLVISNKRRAPDWVFDGQTFERPRLAGMIFYNDEGVECGGLVFGGDRRDGKIEAGALLAFDRYHNNQIVGIQYSESGDRRGHGICVWDRPVGMELMREYLTALSLGAGPEKDAALKRFEHAEKDGSFGRQRLFMGLGSSGDIKVSMADSQGRERIRLMVGADDVPRLEFLDGAGKVTFSLPPGGCSGQTT